MSTLSVPSISRLGCADEFAVYVADRSGTTLISELPITGCDWERVLDDVSSATIQLDLVNGGDECCRAIRGLVRYGYEMVIFRNGAQVWDGPVVDIIPQGENVELHCDDKAGWLKVRPIWHSYDWPDPGIEIADIFNIVVADAMAPDNVPGLVATATATGIRAARTYTTNPPQIAFDAVQELARTGVDYTMVGPTMVAGSFVIPTPPVAYLTDQSLIDLPDSPFLGANFGTQWFVTGDPEQDLIATAGGGDLTSGLVVRIAQEDDIKDQASLDQNARTRWELTGNGATGDVTLHLDPTAPLPIELAVPGAIFDLRIGDTCFPLIGRYRLKRLSASLRNSDDGPSESITATVEPVGTEVLD